MTKHRPGLPPRTLALAAATALVAACATPPDHYHTLRPAAPAAAVPAGTREAARVLSIGPVTVPDALGRDEWLVRTGDTGAVVYGHQLWTQSLGADVAQTLVDYLGRMALPGGLWPDAGPTGSGSGADLETPAPLRLRVQVLRLDSVLAPAPAINDQVRWTLECLPADASPGSVDAGRYRTVRTAVRDAGGAAPAADADAAAEESQRRFDRLARAHSDTVRRVAEDVAAALRDSAAERARDCISGR